MGFKVSVIIPVYNAAQYVEQAVESAVHLEEVGEILLIEDGSPDNALEICEYLHRKYRKVMLLRHKGGINQGAAASRNLGIKNSSFDFIAFLDADDWYLPHRFRKDMEIFTNNPAADGVYGATGFYYQKSCELDLKNLTTLKEQVAPNLLIYDLLNGNAGHFHTNAVTLKKKLLKRVGFFKKELRLHQDTHLWLRCAVQGMLYASDILDPIAVRRVHSGNRISKKSHYSNSLLYKEIFRSFLEIEVAKEVFIIVFKRYIGTKSRNSFLWYPLAIIEVIKNPRILQKVLISR